MPGPNHGGLRIDKLDFPAADSRTPLLHSANHNDASSFVSSAASMDGRGRFFEDVAEGIQAQDRARFQRESVRYVSFAWAIISWYAWSEALTDPCTDARLVYVRAL